MPDKEEPQLRIRVPEDQVGALFGWLAREDALRNGVRLRAEPPGPGTMGAVVDVLTVALGSGGAGVALVRSLCTWLTLRRVDVTITIETSDGRKVQVDVKRARDPDAVIREVAALTAHVPGELP